MGNILLITPGSGVQEVDSTELNSTLDAVAAGGELSESQKRLANSLQTPTQGNVFNTGPVDASEVKAVTGATGASSLAPETVAGGNSAASKDIQKFLGGLTTNTTGQSAIGSGVKLNGGVTGSGGSGFDYSGLQGLLFPNYNQGQSQGQQGVSTIGDVNRIERNENLQLDVDYIDLQNRKRDQLTAHNIQNGILPEILTDVNSPGAKLLNPARFNLTQAQVDAERRRQRNAALVTGGSNRAPIIGAPRASSIIGR